MHVVLTHMKACRCITGSYCCSQYISGVVIATSGRKMLPAVMYLAILLDPQLCLLPHS